jgi:hypothetical protein
LIRMSRTLNAHVRVLNDVLTKQWIKPVSADDGPSGVG